MNIFEIWIKVIYRETHGIYKNIDVMISYTWLLSCLNIIKRPVQEIGSYRGINNKHIRRKANKSLFIVITLLTVILSIFFLILGKGKQKVKVFFLDLLNCILIYFIITFGKFLCLEKDDIVKKSC